MVFGIIGIMLLAGALLGKIGWGWGVVGAIFLYWPATRFWTKYKAASNAVLARYTFDLLSETDRNKVLAAVAAIMSNAKYPSQDPEQELKSMAPEQRYGFIALGMARIGIAPKIGGGWYEVHNPYAEILGAHREIAWVKHQIRLKYGVDVNLNDVVTSTEQRGGSVAQSLAAVQLSKQPALPKDNDAPLRQASGVLDCKTADQGEANAQFQLGDMYEQGQGVPQDYEEAVKWYRLAANQGNAYAQVNLGTMYDNGTGVPQDDEEAVKWYRLAAEQNDVDGQSNLGMMYEHGQGVPQDYEEAVKWYRLAADQGNAQAQANLGKMYYYGRGVPQDAKEAVKLYRLAADQGDADVQFRLGCMYRFGTCVPKDDEEAAKWYRLAANQGNVKAQFQLGDIYEQVQGVPQDYEEAVKWYRLAADQGDAQAQANLGKMYDNGTGIPQDDDEAAKWGEWHASWKHRTQLRISRSHN